MADLLSIPVEQLIQETVGASTTADDPVVIATTDVLIVGSGYGASVAALRIAGLQAGDVVNRAGDA